MALQTFNFAGLPLLRDQRAPQDYSAIENFLPNVLQSYHAPQQLKEEREAAERKKRAEEIAQRFLETYGAREKEAEIGMKEAMAQNYRRLAGGGGGGSGRGEVGLGSQDIAKLSKQQSAMGLDDSVFGGPLKGLPKNEQLFYVKKMEADLNKAKGMTESLSTLNNMQTIMKEHPNLWKSFTLALSNPENTVGIQEYIKRNALNENEKTAIDKFRKLSSDLVVKGGEALGGGARFTDSRQALISSMKPDIANTSKANEYLIDNMKTLMNAGPEWEKALRYGLKNRVKIIDNPEVFRKAASKTASPDTAPTQDMVTIKNDKTGETRTVTREEARQLGVGQ